MSYLLDTNVISELVKPRPNRGVLAWFDQIPDELLYLSALSLGEIRKGVAMLKEPKRQEELRLWLEVELVNWFDNRLLGIDAAVADRWGRLQSEMRGAIPAIDSLLAATALTHNLRLVTRNVKDFQFPSLEMICPWD